MELGLAFGAAGRYRQAIHQFQESARYLRESKNVGRLANLLYNLGLVYNNTGEAVAAAMALEEAVDCARQSQMRRLEAYALLGIGYLYTDLDFFEPALEAFRAAHDIAQDVNEKFLSFYLGMMRATITTLQGDTRLAEEFLNESQAAIEGSSSKVEWGMWLRARGRLVMAQGDPHKAVELLTESCSSLADAHRPAEMLAARFYLALAHHRCNQLDQSIQAVKEAFFLGSQLDSNLPLVRAGRFVKEALSAAAQHHSCADQARGLLLEIERYEETIPAIRRKLRSHVVEVRLAPPKYSIHTLGREDVEVDGKPVEQREWLHQKRVREVFFYLNSQPGGATTEELAMAIWHDTLSPSVKIQVRNAIYRLRSALGHDAVLSIEAGYSFNRALDYQSDMEQFESYIRKGREAEEDSPRVGYYRTACDLYRGHYLPGIDGTWVLVERERLWKLYVDTALYSARYLFQTHSYNSAVECCERILREDGAVEEAHRLILSIYGKRGEKGLLKRQYEKCVRALSDLGLKPSNETISLYKKLLNA
jgi:two-component SAPR family response regulator